MTDLEYLKEHILDELDDAVDYMTKATEHKTDWMGKYFFNIAEQETVHANTLATMFNKVEKPANISEADHNKMYHAIMDKYSDTMARYEQLKRFFCNRA